MHPIISLITTMWSRQITKAPVCKILLVKIFTCIYFAGRLYPNKEKKTSKKIKKKKSR